jgi:hypothetical protein
MMVIKSINDVQIYRCSLQFAYITATQARTASLRQSVARLKVARHTQSAVHWRFTGDLLSVIIDVCS